MGSPEVSGQPGVQLGVSTLISEKGFSEEGLGLWKGPGWSV